MKIRLLLPLIFVFTATILNAQDATKKEVLMQTSKELALEARNKFSKAVLAAKEKGWPIQYASQNQNIAKLISVDEKGWPKYYISFADPVQAITINANKVWPGAASNLNLSGSDDNMTNKLGVWDEGSPLLTHKEFTGRITQKDTLIGVVTDVVNDKGLLKNNSGSIYKWLKVKPSPEAIKQITTGSGKSGQSKWKEQTPVRVEDFKKAIEKLIK